MCRRPRLGRGSHSSREGDRAPGSGSVPPREIHAACRDWWWRDKSSTYLAQQQSPDGRGEPQGRADERKPPVDLAAGQQRDRAQDNGDLQKQLAGVEVVSTSL